jgi:hypothetical protein
MSVAVTSARAMPPSDLLLRIYEMNKLDDPARIVELVEAEWPSFRSVAPTSIEAEICRQAMLACYRQRRYYDGYLWRMRAMIRAASAGWLYGVAALLQTEALRIQAQENGDRQPMTPGYVVLPQALAILDEMRPFAGAHGPIGVPQPSPQLIGRMYHEKRAFLLLASGRYSDALAAYDSALAFVADDERGRLKVRGGRALVLYLSARDASARAEAMEETTQVANECARLGQREIGRIASENVERMKTGRAELLPYEVL